jgi:hypothetical protein
MGFNWTKNTLVPGVEKVKRELPKQMRDAVQAEAEALKVVAQSRVPVKTGALKNSARVVMDPDKAKASIVFGNTDVDYAVIVHENLEAHHENGQAKFLESTLMEATSGMAERLATRMRFEKWAK